MWWTSRSRRLWRRRGSRAGAAWVSRAARRLTLTFGAARASPLLTHGGETRRWRASHRSTSRATRRRLIGDRPDRAAVRRTVGSGSASKSQQPADSRLLIVVLQPHGARRFCQDSVATCRYTQQRVVFCLIWLGRRNPGRPPLRRGPFRVRTASRRGGADHRGAGPRGARRGRRRRPSSRGAAQHRRVDAGGGCTTVRRCVPRRGRRIGSVRVSATSGGCGRAHPWPRGLHRRRRRTRRARHAHDDGRDRRLGHRSGT